MPCLDSGRETPYCGDVLSAQDGIDRRCNGRVVRDDGADAGLPAQWRAFAQQLEQLAGQRSEQRAEPERLGQCKLRGVDSRHRVECTAPLLNLLIWVAHIDNLRVSL